MTTYEGGYSGTEGYTGTATYESSDSSDDYAGYTMAEGGTGMAPVYHGSGGKSRSFRKKTDSSKNTTPMVVNQTSPRTSQLAGYTMISGASGYAPVYVRRPQASGSVSAWKRPSWFTSPFKRLSEESERLEYKGMKAEGKKPLKSQAYKFASFGVGAVKGAGEVVVKPWTLVTAPVGLTYSFVKDPFGTGRAINKKLQIAPAQFSGEIVGSMVAAGGLFKGMGALSKGRTSRIGSTENIIQAKSSGSLFSKFRAKTKYAVETKSMTGKKYFEYAGERRGYQKDYDGIRIQESEIVAKPTAATKWNVWKQKFETLPKKSKESVKIQSGSLIGKKGFVQISKSKLGRNKVQYSLSYGSFSKTGDIYGSTFKLSKGRIAGSPWAIGGKVRKVFEIRRPEKWGYSQERGIYREPDLFRIYKSAGIQKKTGIRESAIRELRIMKGQKIGRKGSAIFGKPVQETFLIGKGRSKNFPVRKIIPEYNIFTPNYRGGFSFSPKIGLGLGALAGFNIKPIQGVTGMTGLKTIRSPVSKPNQIRSPVTIPDTIIKPDTKQMPKTELSPGGGPPIPGAAFPGIPPAIIPVMPVALPFGGGGMFGGRSPKSLSRFKPQWTKSIGGLVFKMKGEKKMFGNLTTGIGARS